MSKYKKIFTRVVAISTYAIIFCIMGNMVMPALIVESVQAQALTNSTASQPKITASDQKLLDKAKADSKDAVYKDLGLNKQEIAFFNAFDMDAISQKADKYVTPNKSGILSIDTNGFRKDGSVKLSRSNTEIAILIINKQITKYNSLVRGINEETTPKVKNISVSNVPSNTNSGVQLTKSINGKMISLDFKVDTSKLANPSNSGNIKSASVISIPGWPFCSWGHFDTRIGWWGAMITILDDCATQLYKSTYMAAVGVLLGSLLNIILPGYGVAIGITMAIAGKYAAGTIDWMNRACGNQGVILSSNYFYPFAFAIPLKKC